MTLPAEISVSFDFSSGATFGFPITLGDAKYGLLGTGTLAASVPTEPVDALPVKALLPDLVNPTESTLPVVTSCAIPMRLVRQRFES